MTTTGGGTGPVVVGVDGSPQSTAAVRWAAREALALGAPLLIVHAWLWPLYRVPLGPGPGAPADAGLRAAAERVLLDARDTARSTACGVPVETSLVVTDASTALIEAAAGASRLVVGNRGLGGFTGLLLGSTGVSVASRSTSPVVVVRGGERLTGPVAVGVDGSVHGIAAVSAACAEAGLRRSRLLLVHAWTVPLTRNHLATASYADAVAAGERAGQLVLDDALEQASREAPDVPVEAVLGDRSAAAELVTVSGRAQLVVVGSGGATALSGLLLGSTTHALIHHAACPVLVHR